MIDIENELFTGLATDLRSKFSNITVDSVTTYSPSEFPFVCMEIADNYSLQSTRDSGSTENHVVVMCEINAYSNKSNGKKAECKAIMAEIDDFLCKRNFTRLSMIPINSEKATIYRISARYTAVVSKNKVFYRR